ncbi:MAG: aminoacyl-tRNA deacylase [Candidatus Methylomirabilales bacterium]
MPVKRLKAFLDEHQVRYRTMSHSSAYTAQETAAATHIPGKSLAKTVMVKVDGRMTMVVLPGTYKIDLHLLKKALGASTVELAPEAEFTEMFPDCEIGAMPPFGNLYGVPVLVAESLRENREIAFSAGTHTEVIAVDFADFERLVTPTALTCAERA